VVAFFIFAAHDEVMTKQFKKVSLKL